MIKTKVAFLEGRLLSSQSEKSEKFSKRKFSKSPIEAEKNPPPKKSHFCVDHVNRLFMYFS